MKIKRLKSWMEFLNSFILLPLTLSKMQQLVLMKVSLLFCTAVAESIYYWNRFNYEKLSNCPKTSCSGFRVSF